MKSTKLRYEIISITHEEFKAKIVNSGFNCSIVLFTVNTDPCFIINYKLHLIS